MLGGWGAGRGELVGVTEWICLSLRPGAHPLRRWGASTFFGLPIHNVMGIPPEQGSRHKGWFGVEGYSLSARKDVFTKETGGEWPRLVKAASMEAPR